MLIIGNCICIITLVVIIYQDIKYRMIHFILLPLLFFSGLYLFFLREKVIYEILLNLFFLGIILGSLIGYNSLKNKKISNPVDTIIGLGDILFFIAITPFFYHISFLLFFTTGMIFSLILHFLFNHKNKIRIPLAGYMSIYFLLLAFTSSFLENDFFYINKT